VCAVDAQRKDHRVVVITIAATDIRETETAVAVRARDALNSSFRRCRQIYADHDSSWVHVVNSSLLVQWILKFLHSDESGNILSPIHQQTAIKLIFFHICATWTLVTDSVNLVHWPLAVRCYVWDNGEWSRPDFWNHQRSVTVSNHHWATIWRRNVIHVCVPTVVPVLHVLAVLCECQMNNRPENYQILFHTLWFIFYPMSGSWLCKYLAKKNINRFSSTWFI